MKLVVNMCTRQSVIWCLMVVVVMVISTADAQHVFNGKTFKLIRIIPGIRQHLC